MAETFLNYIAGQWAECKSKKTFPNVNPANTDEVVGLFQASGPEDAASAFDAAVKAQPAWTALPAPRRGEYLFKAAEILESGLGKLAEEMTREEGKTLPESKGEVKRAINIFRYFGGEGARQFSYQIPSERENVFCYTLRKPLGVAGLITPWNFPRAISFTGSCEVGNKLHEKMNGRKVRIQLEMGGKNPTVVLKDADLDYAADILVNGSFFSTGQKCTACSRAVIEKAVYEPLVEKLVAKTRRLKVGNGLEPGVDVGPAVDANQLETDLKYIEIAKKEGAELLCGGNRLAGGAYDKGHFIEPTIFARVTPEMRIAP